MNKLDNEFAKLTKLGINFDVCRKEIKNKIECVIYFLSSLASGDSVWELNYSLINLSDDDFLKKVINGSINKVNNIYEAFIDFSNGMSVIIYKNSLYVVETRNYPSRSITEADTEKTIRGSKDCFNENIITNIGLIRRRIKSKDLFIKMNRVSKNSKCDVAICCLLDRVNKKTLNKIIEQVSRLELDGLTMADRALEEHLFKQGLNPYPLVRYSERPDIIASLLLKGQIAIVVDTSSSVIIVPTTIFDHSKHVSEYKEVSLVGSFIRIVRYIAILLSIFLIPIWLLTLNNNEFTSYIFVKINNSNNIPILLQVVIVEITIEILKIATIHTPNQLTSAMGLVATLILGQMAVEIGWFSFEVLLFCAISSICSFACPSYELSNANKIVELLLILMVGLFNEIGFLIGVYLFIVLLGSIKMYDVPYLYPLFPFDYKELKKVVFRSVSK